MERSLMCRLLQWKADPDRKPLLLKGMRQVGKTYLLREFGQRAYDDVAYFNFEGNAALNQLFESDLDPHRIVLELGVLLGRVIKPGRTLIIFDEIQFCNAALTSLKYFCENAPEHHVVAAGSLLGLLLSRPLSFPVGKTDMLTMYPMSFEEYLIAQGEQMLTEYMRTATSLSEPFHNRLKAHLRGYMVCGGMPEAVKTWHDTQDAGVVDAVLSRILDAFALDFAKHAPVADAPKLSLIWQSIPNQLARENNKFIYGHVKPGARAKDLEDALQWLVDAGMVHKVMNLSRPGIPLSAYANPSSFKLYLADIGLLRRMAGLPAEALYQDIPLYREFKGALCENLCLQEFVILHGRAPYYWTSGNRAEVDFVAQFATQIVPIEVKAGENTKSRSLSVYREHYHPDVAVKASLKPLELKKGLVCVPLYALWLLEQYIGEALKILDASQKAPEGEQIE